MTQKEYKEKREKISKRSDLICRLTLFTGLTFTLAGVIGSIVLAGGTNIDDYKLMQLNNIKNNFVQSETFQDIKQGEIDKINSLEINMTDKQRAELLGKLETDEYILSTMKEVSPEVYSKYIVCKYQYDQEIEDNFLKSMAPSLIGFLSAVTLGIPCILYMAAQKDKLEILDEEYENGIEIEM